jgi:hypothetical protein
VEVRVDRIRELLVRETLIVPAAVEVAEDAVPAMAYAVISVMTARTTGARTLRVVDKVVRVAKVATMSMVPALMSLQNLLSKKERLKMVLLRSRPMPRASSRSQVKVSVSFARPSAPTPPHRTTSSSPPR